MKFTIKTFYIFAIILSLCIISNAQTNWVGDYFFSEDGGETVGGSKIYISHTISITEENEKLNAQIYSQGFQTSRDILADVKTVNDKIEFYFREKGVDQYTEEYNKGDLLLSLEKKFVNGKIKLITSWKKFKPILDTNDKSNRVYFKRIKKPVKKTKAKLNWVRIESPAKDWSFAVPKNYLVNVDDDDDTYRIYYASEDLSISIYMDKKTRSKKRFREQFSRLPKKMRKEYQFFELGDFIGSQSKNEFEKFNSESRSISFASDKGFNSMSIATANPNLPAFIEFLGSIKLDGKRLYKITGSQINEIETVDVTTLKTDEEIIEALKKEDSDQDEPLDATQDKIENKTISTKGDYNRSFIVLTKPRPGYPMYASKSNITGQVRFRIEFLANGTLGKIELVSSIEKSLDKAAFKAAKKIKFLPAKRDGKAVDVRGTIVYNFSISEPF